jgi:anaerobic magnesium-protoporphyrin IX monomethyl ester cyclase
MPRWVGGAVSHEVHVIPIGLMYVAAAVRSARAADDIRLAESSLDCPTDESFETLLETYQPDVVGIRSIVFFGDELRRLTRLVRTHSQAAIVVGGPVVDAWRAELFDRVADIDVAVKGEGEVTFPILLGGRSFAEVPGILFRDEQGVVETPDAAEVPDLDALPFPAYDLIDMDRYGQHLSYAYNSRRQGVLVTSRGCVYSCSFCFRPRGGIRWRSAANVFAEIVWLHESFGVDDFYVVDDIFNVSVDRALDLFDRLANAPFRVRLYFVNGLRTDLVTEEFVDRAIAAGAVWFTFAIESASETIQRLTRKHVRLDRAHAIIAYTQRKDVVVNISTMYGFPGETVADAQLTLDWLDTLPRASVLPYHFCLRFFPGCDIRDQALAAGFTAEQLDESTASCYHDSPAATPTLSRADMLRIQLDYHRRFGLRNSNRMAESIEALGHAGFSDDEIARLYSVLLRRPVMSTRELLLS